MNARYTGSTNQENAPTPAPAEAQAPVEEKKPETPKISIDKFFETQLRAGQIVSAERIENADKLLKLQVDLGDEKRQIVAGIALAYEPEALVGRRIIIVANLKPAKLRGVESQGMLLAADFDGRPVLAGFDEPIAPGTPVR